MTIRKTDPPLYTSLGTHIKFNPELLLEVSHMMEQQYKRLLSGTQNVEAHSDRLLAVWQGDQAQLHIANMRKWESRARSLTETLLTLSRDLAESSGLYASGERAAKAEAESLPTEGVFLV